MDNQFFCSECGSEHGEPADARLGHQVLCLDCALTAEYEASLAGRLAAVVSIARTAGCDRPLAA